MEQKYLEMNDAQLQKEQELIQKEYKEVKDEYDFIASYSNLLHELHPNTTCLKEGVVFIFDTCDTLKYRMYDRQNKVWTDWITVNVQIPKCGYKFSFEGVKIYHIPRSEVFQMRKSGYSEERIDKHFAEIGRFYITANTWWFYSQKEKDAEAEYDKENHIKEQQLSHWYTLSYHLNDNLVVGKCPFKYAYWQLYTGGIPGISWQEGISAVVHGFCTDSPYCKSMPESGKEWMEVRNRMADEMINGIMPSEFINLSVDYFDWKDASFTPQQGVGLFGIEIGKIESKLESVRDRVEEISKYSAMTSDERLKRLDEIKQKEREVRQKAEKQKKKEKGVSRTNIILRIINVVIIIVTYILIKNSLWLSGFLIIPVIILLIIIRKIVMKIVRKVSGVKK